MKYALLFLGAVSVVIIGWWGWSQVAQVSGARVFSSARIESFQTPRGHEELPPITILFGGDIMLDRYIRTVTHRQGNDFVLASLKSVLSAQDRVIANLEGPITVNPSVSETSQIGEAKNYIFTFPLESADWLKQNHIGIVNLGNNHILNFGVVGVQSTERALQSAAIKYFGSPTAENRTLIDTIRGLKIGLVNYNQFVYQGKEKALADIASIRSQVDVLLLYAHWGKEYVTALPQVKDLAHEFVDAGADVIIGSHPHVIQEKEIYKGKTIYYSLGNFVFDQYQDKMTQQGLLVQLSIDPETKELYFEDIPIFLTPNGQTRLEINQ
ncbi:MAG: CapA family protein [Candidatus Moraniibacteriota bacterium]|nr:MAG: CapA family protein [Candidatus Moranbacteria bacterium]